MKNKLKFCMVMMLFLGSIMAFSQQPVITGRVTDQEGLPLPGVTVVIKGTTQGTVTDIDGHFSLSDVSSESVLVFSFVGMESQEILVAKKKVLNVSLKADAIALDEVVAVGYGSMKRSDLTGAVATVQSKDIAKISSTNLGQAIQGRMAGVQITQGSGAPGAGVDVKIRGIGSVLSNNSPLVLVDGFAGNLNDLDADNIESITVLKDAAAASIYGSRAANGVILVTTKMGKKGKSVVTFKSELGWQSLTQHPDYLNAHDWAIHQNEGRQYNGLEPYWVGSQAPETITESTDWLDYTFNTALLQDYHVGISGGTESVRYSIGLGYIKQEGTVIGSKFDRYNVRLKLEKDVNKWFTTGVNMNFLKSNSQNSLGKIQETLLTVLRTPPTIPTFFEDGTPGFVRDEYLGESHFLNSNGTITQNLETQDNYNKNNKSVLNLFAELTPLKGLKYKFVVNGYVSNAYSQGWEDKWEIYDIDDVDHLNPIRESGPAKLSNGTTQRYDWEVQNILTYDRNWNDHKLHALLGYSAEKYNSTGFNASKTDFPNNEIKVLSAGNEFSNIAGSSSTNSLESQFGRLQYSYKDKYLFQGNVRRDGSSVFAPGNQFGVFPSFSGGWRLSEEPFVKELSFIDNLKLRYGWGRLGNANIPSFAWISTFNVSGGYVLGDSQARYPAYYITNMTNEDAKWETTTTSNLGLEAALFGGHITFEGDVYSKKTTDMLLKGTIPYSTGLKSGPILNIGEVQNKGWEAVLGYHEKIRDINFSAAFNISHNQNEVVDLGGVNPSVSNAIILDEGYAIGTYWGYAADGIWKSYDEIDNNAHRSGVKPGMIRFKDTNGYGEDGELTGKPDGEINDADKQVIGNHSPKYMYGLSLSLDFKGVDFSMLFQGEADKDMLIESVYGGNGEGINDNIDQYYFDNRAILDDEGNVISGTYVASGALKETIPRNSLEVHDVSYLRLKNIQIGYTVPSQVLKSVYIKSARFYLSASNLITWTDFIGWDPEFEGGIANGAYSRGGNDFYPLQKTVSAGVQLTF